MNQNKYIAKIISGEHWQAPKGKSKNGLCLSGGGSRALSGGLGQLIGLKSLKNSDGGSLLDSVDYISSVSGGAWLTSIFTFSKNKNMDTLLGVYTPPNQLDENNIGDLPIESIGHVPSKLSYTNMIDIVDEKIGLNNITIYPETRKWVWPVIVGELILKPYELYEGTMEGRGRNLKPMPKRFFTLNEEYMQENINSLIDEGAANSTLNSDDFYYHQAGRPFPIINANIKIDYQAKNSALLPIQATPIAMGGTGSAVQSGTFISADGAVEPFGFSSTYESTTTDAARIEIERRYSLSDIVACSSAFFAQMFGTEVTEAATKSFGKESNTAVDTLADLSTFIPRYNYWPVSEKEIINQEWGFADGGNLDNTGLLGMLARTDADNIVVCYNSGTALGSEEEFSVEGYDKNIAAVDIDIPILFGYQPSPVNNKYILFSNETPAELDYLKAAQVFESTAFGPLVSELFSNCNGQKSPATAYTSSLNVFDNEFAGIKNRGMVDVLWIYNTYSEEWVDKIRGNSRTLANQIERGRTIPSTDYNNFPNYSTVSQISLNATQVNALAQYQAWVINEVGEKIQSMYCK